LAGRIQACLDWLDEYHAKAVKKIAIDGKDHPRNLPLPADKGEHVVIVTLE